MMGWAVLGLIAWTLVALFTLVLIQITGAQEQAERSNEEPVFPFFEAAIPQIGNG
jgi:hypothetical protein